MHPAIQGALCLAARLLMEQAAFMQFILIMLIQSSHDAAIGLFGSGSHRMGLLTTQQAV